MNLFRKNLNPYKVTNAPKYSGLKIFGLVIIGLFALAVLIGSFTIRILN